MSEKKKTVMAMCSKVNNAGTIGSPGKCISCGADLWVSSTTIDAIREGHPDIADQEIHTICVECAIPLMEKSEVRAVTPSKEQIQEILGALDKDKVFKTKL